MNTVELVTNCGTLKGLDLEDHREFLGIQYATAGRWEYPEVVTSWDGVLDATYFKDCSYQHRGFDDDATVNPFYHYEFRDGLEFTYSEDCQYLNIYAPKQAENCPVFVYIHGGSFTGGSSNEAQIDGSHFAKNGILFVSLNYRLNAYGFCSHPDLTDEQGRCGNFGLYDQVEALRWIKDNIAAFGGNPEKITLSGQSAGAMSVDIHLSNPLCKGWFSGAVLMSGAGMQRFLAKPLLPEKTRAFWDKIIENAGCKDIFELKAADKEVLYRAWNKACKEDYKMMSMLYTLPVCDGTIITKEGFNKHTIPELPKIFGVTKNDMVPIILQKIDKKWVAADKASPCYIYYFARSLPGDEKGAWHSSDLLYAFSTLDRNWRPFEDVDYQISDQLAEAFMAFARTGNPNCNAIPQWEPGAKKVMSFGETTKEEPWNKKELLKNTVNGGASI